MDKMDGLRLLMRKCRVTQVDIAELLGITEKTLSLKMNEKIDFWWHEVEIICNTLGIENPMQYFSKKE